MKLSEFINELKKTRTDWMDKEVVIVAPNEMMFEPKLKAVPKDGISLITSKGEIDKLVITF